MSSETTKKQRRFHYFVKCSKCGRSMCKDRSLAECWLILRYGNKDCEHDFKKVKKAEAWVTSELEMRLK